MICIKQTNNIILIIYLTIYIYIFTYIYICCDFCRALKDTVGLFPRPQLDLSPSNFAKLINEALNRTLVPPFDPYSSSLAYMLASYAVPYVGLVGYVGTNPLLKGYVSKRVSYDLLKKESF